MYVKIRKITAVSGDEDLIVTISKKSNISVLREEIKSKLGVEAAMQRLFYKGKQLSDEYQIMDYDIQLNDVIQLMIQSVTPEKSPSSSKKSKKRVVNEDKFVDVKSKYYEVGDLVDVQDEQYGGWFEYVVSGVKARKADVVDGIAEENDIHFFSTSELENDQAPYEAKFDEIRPRARYTYKFSELEVGMNVMVNYNIEEPTKRGYWYDMCIDEINKETKSVIGTVQVGKSKVPLEDCKIKFVNEIMRIESPKLGSKRRRVSFIPPRKSQYYCMNCKDNKAKKCRECGCRKCGGKDNPSTIILCDECDYGYHLSCLDPPLTKIPDDSEWYCPECKNDENEIVKAGDKLKISSKKAKMASKSNEARRDWGRGMACVGRTTECTIVPKDHYGHVPGVEVGTCWKFRLQVSEAGIHRPHVAGIHGRETDGAYSIVLSGGYEDDVDYGNEFWYTGSGGRDLSGNKRISEQSCDQKLTRMNRALALNCYAPLSSVQGADAKKNWEKGKPVRVVRNYKLGKHSDYAPKDGNRYDGLYKVVKYFPQKGKSGFLVWRYLLRRDDPTPAPWEKGGQELEMIYPPGYLEANDLKEEQKPQSKKRKRTSKEKDTNQSSKKQKVEPYKLDKHVKELINLDTLNKNLWSECKQTLKLGKLQFLAKVKDVFICICCQEVVHQPVTTECKHNVCFDCLKRSFSSEIYTCPYCRFHLGASYEMPVNENLSEALLQLLPGYNNAR